MNGNINNKQQQPRERKGYVGTEGPAPALSFVSPSFGAEGDTIQIIGSGFDPNPMNTCVFVGGDGARAQVISATPSNIIAQIGPVPQVQQGDVVVVTGTGTNLPLQAVTFAGGTLADMSAISFMGRTESHANTTFQLAAVSPNTDGAVFSPTAGGLVVSLTGNSRDGSLIKIDLHLRTPGGWMEVVKNLSLHTNLGAVWLRQSQSLNEPPARLTQTKNRIMNSKKLLFTGLLSFLVCLGQTWAAATVIFLKRRRYK